jgi:hypothetical protein
MTMVSVSNLDDEPCFGGVCAGHVGNQVVRSAFAAVVFMTAGERVCDGFHLLFH